MAFAFFGNTIYPGRKKLHTRTGRAAASHGFPNGGWLAPLFATMGVAGRHEGRARVLCQRPERCLALGTRTTVASAAADGTCTSEDPAVFDYSKVITEPRDLGVAFEGEPPPLPLPASQQPPPPPPPPPTRPGPNLQVLCPLSARHPCPCTPCSSLYAGDLVYLSFPARTIYHSPVPGHAADRLISGQLLLTRAYSA